MIYILIMLSTYVIVDGLIVGIISVDFVVSRYCVMDRYFVMTRSCMMNWDSVMDRDGVMDRDSVVTWGWVMNSRLDLGSTVKA